MAKITPKPSDRGRDTPEPGPPPGARAEQRGTVEQLQADRPHTDDPAVEWERSEQEKLPPRGQGSLHNQGAARGAMIGEPAGRAESPGREEPAAPRVTEGLHSGGTRGPSNQNR